MYLPTCNNDSPLCDFFVERIQENKRLYHLISECLTKYLLYNTQSYQSNGEICEHQINYFIPEKILSVISWFFPYDSHFLVKQYEQLINTLLSDDYVYIPLFQRYLLMQLSYGAGKNKMPQYGKTVVNNLQSMFLSELKKYYKTINVSNQEKIDYAFIAKMLTSMALDPFANLFKAQDRFSYGYGFLLSDVDYKLFDIYGFKGTLNLLDSLWGRENGYNSEKEVKKLLESGGLQYVCKSYMQLERENLFISKECRSFNNRITNK